MDFISCLYEANKTTANTQGNNNLLYTIISPSFHISFSVIQLAQLNRMIKEIQI